MSPPWSGQWRTAVALRAALAWPWVSCAAACCPPCRRADAAVCPHAVACGGGGRLLWSSVVAQLARMRHALCASACHRLPRCAAACAAVGCRAAVVAIACAARVVVGLWWATGCIASACLVVARNRRQAVGWLWRDAKERLWVVGLGMAWGVAALCFSHGVPSSP